MTKWSDKYFFSVLMVGMASAIIVPLCVYRYSPFSALIGFIMGSVLSVGVRIDWIDFERRHNNESNDKRNRR